MILSFCFNKKNCSLEFLVLSIITFFRVIKKNRVTRRVDLKEEIKKEILEDRGKL